MKCPFCGYAESKVIDSRPTDEGERIRRRRECLNCHTRFTTYEVIDAFQPVVVKKDGSKEWFFNNDSDIINFQEVRANTEDIPKKITGLEGYYKYYLMQLIHRL